MFAVATRLKAGYRSRPSPLHLSPMERLTVLIPKQQLDWLDRQIDGLENRSSFVRRLFKREIDCTKRQQPPVA